MPTLRHEDGVRQPTWRGYWKRSHTQSSHPMQYTGTCSVHVQVWVHIPGDPQSVQPRNATTTGEILSLPQHFAYDSRCTYFYISDCSTIHLLLFLQVHCFCRFTVILNGLIYCKCWNGPTRCERVQVSSVQPPNLPGYCCSHNIWTMPYV